MATLPYPGWLVATRKLYKQSTTKIMIVNNFPQRKARGHGGKSNLSQSDLTAQSIELIKDSTIVGDVQHSALHMELWPSGLYRVRPTVRGTYPTQTRLYGRYSCTYTLRLHSSY